MGNVGVFDDRFLRIRRGGLEFSVIFYLRKQRSGNVSIEFRLRSNEDITPRRATGIIINPLFTYLFSKKRKRFEVSKYYENDLLKLNEMLDSMEAYFKEIGERAEEGTRLIDIVNDNLLERRRRISLLIALDDFIEFRRTERSLASGTVEAYKSCRKHLRNYLEVEKSVKIRVDEFSYFDGLGFRNYLTGLGIGRVVNNRYLGIIKNFYSYAFDMKYVKLHPFLGLQSIPRNRKERHKRTAHLPETGIRKLEKLLSDSNIGEREREAIAIFLVLSHTGLSYVDYLRLSESCVFSGKRSYIKIRRKKTGTLCIIPVHRRIAKAVGLYGWDSLPKPSRTYLNRILKKLSDEVGLSIHITTKIGRTTYAVMLLEKYRLSFEEIGKILGHSTVSVTQQFYAQLGFQAFDERIAEKMASDLG